MSNRKKGAASSADEVMAAALSEWAENLESFGPETVITHGEGHEPGRAFLESILGSSEAVDRAVGRPPLKGTRRGEGKSPIRQVRLPRDLDELLIERAEAEHRKPSEVVREALYAYLGKAS